MIGLNLKIDSKSKLHPLSSLPQYTPLLTAPCLSSYSDLQRLFLCMLVIPPLAQIPSIRVSGERWQRSGRELLFQTLDHPSSVYLVIMRPFNSKTRICKHMHVDCSLTLNGLVSYWLFSVSLLRNHIHYDITS